MIFANNNDCIITISYLIALIVNIGFSSSYHEHIRILSGITKGNRSSAYIVLGVDISSVAYKNLSDLFGIVFSSIMQR